MSGLQLVLASKNRKKLVEMREILGALGYQVLSQAEVGVDLEPEETGDTFEENALIKAREVCAASGLPAISDDSGLEVDALGGEPGVHSARYGGSHDRSDEERTALLLHNMEQMEQRRARYVCVIAVVFPDGRELTARGTCEGEIAREWRGTGGFGYDPVFRLPDGRHMAELDSDEKHRISHRGKALQDMKTKLTEALGL